MNVRGTCGGWRDGNPQYSPRRGLWSWGCAFQSPAIRGRATPLSEGGGYCRFPLFHYLSTR